MRTGGKAGLRAGVGTQQSYRNVTRSDKTGGRGVRNRFLGTVERERERERERDAKARIEGRVQGWSFSGKGR